jgi:hypothetical protein
VNRTIKAGDLICDSEFAKGLVLVLAENEEEYVLLSCAGCESLEKSYVNHYYELLDTTAAR